MNNLGFHPMDNQKEHRNSEGVEFLVLTFNIQLFQRYYTSFHFPQIASAVIHIQSLRDC
ncbi:MAG: hypothetical protein ACI9XO_002847 [Paraglaciecola sp.]|jgi:hypothetical protein